MESEQLSHLVLTNKVLIGNVEKITTHIDEKEKVWSQSAAIRTYQRKAARVNMQLIPGSYPQLPL